MADTNKKLSDSRTLDASEQRLGRYWLDRLVDGELSDAEQQRIVSTLDQIPNGWKKCALGFLESQIWKQSLQALEHDEPSQPSEVGPSPLAVPTNSSSEVPGTHRAVNSKRATMRMPWSGWLSLAATVTIAFVIGNSIQFGGEDGYGGKRPGLNPSDIASAPYDDTGLGKSDGGQTQFITNNNFWDGRPAIPSDVSQILKNYGARVERRSGFFRAKTNDGQSVLIPYEDIQLVPASDDPSY